MGQCYVIATIFAHFLELQSCFSFWNTRSNTHYYFCVPVIVGSFRKCFQEANCSWSFTMWISVEGKLLILMLQDKEKWIWTCIIGAWKVIQKVHRASAYNCEGNLLKASTDSKKILWILFISNSKSKGKYIFLVLIKYDCRLS